MEFEIPKAKKAVHRLLRANVLDGELPEIQGELKRHQAVLRELGLPPFAAEVCFSSIQGEYLPKQFKKLKFDSVGRVNLKGLMS